MAYNREDLELIASHGLDMSMIREVMLEEKHYRLEGIRAGSDAGPDGQRGDRFVPSKTWTPMGVHTGDSITVAPAQTLTDREYQIMRDASIAIIREIGVDTGGSNIQFAVNPRTGEMVVIEMNPRGEPVQRFGVQGHRVSDRQTGGQNWPWGTHWTRFPTISPAKPWRPSSPPLTIAW